MGTIENQDLSSALFGKVRRTLLALFYSRPDESLYIREIVRMTGVGQGAVQRELKQLADAGIITASRQGRMVYYKANRDCPIYDELHRLMTKTAGLADVLRKSLEPLAPQIDIAFIYGSRASFTAGPASDVDVMVVGDVEDLALHRAFAEAEGILDRPVNYTLLTRKEFNRRRKEKDGFLSRVLGGDKISIVGEARDV
jgi:DNA-binding transcriptional ArsR family regulator